MLVCVYVPAQYSRGSNRSAKCTCFTRGRGTTRHIRTHTHTHTKGRCVSWVFGPPLLAQLQQSIDQSIKQADSQLIAEAADGGLTSAHPCTRRIRSRARTWIGRDNVRALQRQMQPRQSIDQHTSIKQGPRMVTRNVQR